MVNGSCTEAELVPKEIGGWSAGYAATKVLVAYRIDPFTSSGQKWLRQLRKATGNAAPTVMTGSTYVEALAERDLICGRLVAMVLSVRSTLFLLGTTSPARVRTRWTLRRKRSITFR